MTLDVAVRAARVDDRDAVAALIGSMGGHDAAGDNPRTRSMFAAAVASPAVRGVVAVTHPAGRVVGYGEVHSRPKIDRSRREAWLSVLAVDAAVRSRGIGTRLLSALDGAAASLGCDAVLVESSTWRIGAHRFYRRHGFVDLGEAQRFSRAVPALNESVEGDLAERFLAAAARAASAVQAVIPGLEHAASVAIGADGAPTEAADRVAEGAICDELASLGVPVASEESGLIWPERGEPGAPDQPWVAVDPLDGSRNFRRGLTPYATAMGLVVDGLPVAGFVCDLTTGQRWWAAEGRGAWRDGARCCPRAGGVIALPSPAGAGDAITVPENAERVRVSGCTTVDLCRVADGAVGAFIAVDRPVVHAHDLAGPWAVLREVGCELRAADGTKLQLVPDPAVTYRVTATAPARAAGPTPPSL